MKELACCFHYVRGVFVGGMIHGTLFDVRKRLEDSKIAEAFARENLARERQRVLEDAGISQNSEVTE